MAERLRGRRAVAQRLRRLQIEPLCRDCAAKGAVREASVLISTESWPGRRIISTEK